MKRNFLLSLFIFAILPTTVYAMESYTILRDFPYDKCTIPLIDAREYIFILNNGKIAYFYNGAIFLPESCNESFELDIIFFNNKEFNNVEVFPYPYNDRSYIEFPNGSRIVNPDTMTHSDTFNAHRFSSSKSGIYGAEMISISYKFNSNIFNYDQYPISFFLITNISNFKQTILPPETTYELEFPLIDRTKEGSMLDIFSGENSAFVYNVPYSTNPAIENQYRASLTIGKNYELDTLTPNPESQYDGLPKISPLLLHFNEKFSYKPYCINFTQNETFNVITQSIKISTFFSLKSTGYDVAKDLMQDMVISRKNENTLIENCVVLLIGMSPIEKEILSYSDNSTTYDWKPIKSVYLKYKETNEIWKFLEKYNRLFALIGIPSVFGILFLIKRVMKSTNISKESFTNIYIIIKEKLCGVYDMFNDKIESFKKKKP